MKNCKKYDSVDKFNEYLFERFAEELTHQLILLGVKFE